MAKTCHLFSLCLLTFVHLFAEQGALGIYEEDGPEFLEEPPSRVEFVNDKGLNLNCSARGRPLPSVGWTNLDGTGLEDLVGLRYSTKDGTLVFVPFQAEAYRPDVHSGTYRCTASNNFGTLVSREVRVRAVVKQTYEPEVANVRAVKDFPVLLHCSLPSFLRDYVSVTSWIHGSLNILPTLGFEQGKYYMFDDGHLLIWQVSLQDSYSAYQCRTFHRLTGEIRVSSPGKIIVVEGFEASRPVIQNKGVSSVVVKENERLILPCVAYGHPRPESKWFKREGGKLVPMGEDGYDEGRAVRGTGEKESVLVRYGALIINSIRVSHKGTYVCNISNVHGSDLTEVHVTVRSNLIMNLEPEKLTVNLGKTAEFNCLLTGEPAANIQWMKNGRILRAGNTGGKVRFIGQSRIQIVGVQKEDQGIYQCSARNDYETIQRSAQLWLGDSPPKFLYRFIEQSLQPGPSISLKCSASGNPTPQITWLLDGFELPKSDRFQMGQYANVYGDVISHVNITSVRVEDGGQYECVATNRAGRDIHSANLNIYGAPFVRSVADITAVAGKPFRFKCPVGGYPIETIIFEKDGKKVSGSRRVTIRDGSLMIENIERADEAAYSCRAGSKQGQSNQISVKVRVVVPPKITPFSFPPWVKVNERAGIQCIVSTGDPPFELVWFKDRVAISSNVFAAHGDAMGEHGRKTVEITAFPAYQFGGSVGSGSVGERSRFSGKQISSHNNNNNNHHHWGSSSVGVKLSHSSRSGSIGDELEKMREFLSDSEISPPLPSSSSKIIIGHSDFSSYLTIPSISIEHMGNYTCTTKSLISGESASYTAQLTVNVPPRFTIEPKDQHITVGTQVMIDCQAEGIPQPQIGWKQLLGSGEKKEEFREVGYRTPGVLVGENGSLVISRVTEDHGGYYSCVGSQPPWEENGGKLSSSQDVEISKMIHLVVNVPPRIKARPPKEIVRRLETALLKCEVTGDEPIHISWFSRGVRLESSMDPRYSVTSTPSGSYKYLSELTIKQVSSEDRGDYDCVASNSFGQDQVRIALLVQERPQTPKGFSVVEKTSRSVLLSWSPLGKSEDNDSPLVNLVLHYSKEGGGEKWKEHEDRSGTGEEKRTKDGKELKKKSIAGDQTSIVINNLMPATKYYFYLVATNSLGNSEPTPTLKVITDSEPPSGQPLDVLVESMSSTQLQVSWKNVRKDLQNGDILGYNIRYRSGRDDLGAFNWSRLVLPNPNEMNTGSRKMLNNLKKYEEYHIAVQAFNEKGSGPFSTPVLATTMEDVPSAPPQDISCSPLTSHSLQLNWHPPPLGMIHGKLQGYRILAEAQPQNDDDNFPSGSDFETKVGVSTSAVMHNFHPFTNYSVQITAFTRVGEGVFSRPVHCQTKESVPSEPSAIKAIMASFGSYIISWLPPRMRNGLLVKYNVYIRISGGGREIRTLKRNLPAHLLHYEVNELKDREAYEAWVTAETSVGEGQSTKSVAFSVRADRRDIPAAITSHGRLVSIPWKTSMAIPCENVGEGVTLHWFHRDMRLSESTRMRVLGNSSLLLTTVEKNDSGNISCRVNNQFGSDSITYVLRVQTPPTAPLLHSTGSSSSGIKLQWKQGDNGGSPILAFNLVFRKEDGEWEEITLGRKLNTYLVENLTCGTEYEFLLSGVNKIGSGDPSRSVKARTKGSRPKLPLSENFLQADSSSITLNLSDWLNLQEECPILEVIVDYQSKGTNWIPMIQNEVKGITEISSLVPDTEYKVRVIARNAAGSTSEEYFITTSLHKGGLTSVNYNRGPEKKTNTYLILSTGLSISLFLVIVAVGGLWWRKRNCDGDRNQSGSGFPLKDLDRDYAVIQAKYISDCDRIPESGADINPYATFQLPEKANLTPNYSQSYVYTQPRYSDNFQSRNAIPGGGILPSSAAGGTLRGKSYKNKKLNDNKNKGGESDEYDSLASDSDDPANMGIKASFHRNSKFQDETLPANEKYGKSLPKRAKIGVERNAQIYQDAVGGMHGRYNYPVAVANHLGNFVPEPHYGAGPGPLTHTNIASYYDDTGGGISLRKHNHGYFPTANRQSDPRILSRQQMTDDPEFDVIQHQDYTIAV